MTTPALRATPPHPRRGTNLGALFPLLSKEGCRRQPAGWFFALVFLFPIAVHAALFDDDEARKQICKLRNQVEARQKAIEERLSAIDARLGTLDSSGQNRIVDLAQLIESLKQDVAKLRGSIEVLSNQTETLERRQKDLYVDLDNRLRKLEQTQTQLQDKLSQLVRLFFRGGTALALAQLVLQLSLRLLELSQAVVEVDVEILLAPLQRLGLVREHLDRPAQLRYVLLQRFDQLGEVDDAVLARRIQRSKPRVDRREALLDGLLARFDLVPQLEDLLARLVVVEKGRVGRAREERGPKRKRDPQPHRSSIRRCRACRCGGFSIHILLCEPCRAVFHTPRFPMSI